MATELDTYLSFVWAEEYYRNLDYKYIWTPTVVELECLLATIEESKILKVGDNHGVVGSAEQGFLQLIKDGIIYEGMNDRFFSLGSCVRPLDIGPLHQKHFKKLELFSVVESEYELDSVIAGAMGFFKELSPNAAFTLEPQEDGSYDVNLNGVEVGSYGIREFKGLTYVYGTGLAMPRFNLALKLSY